MELGLTETVIKLPSTCADVGEVEHIIALSFERIPVQHTDTQQTLIIDMSSVSYIIAPCLIYLISFIQNAIEDGYETSFRLPETKSVRDILRIWRFPIVLKEVTGKGFASMVSNEDLKYFGETHYPGGDYYKKFGGSDEGLAELIKKDFFSLASIPFGTENEKSVAVDNQHRKWNENIIRSILKRHLETYDGIHEGLIPNRIIYECMTNAIRHSNAVQLVTGSYFDKFGKFLTISYWDNGDSIIATLQKALKENLLARVKDIEGNDLNTALHFSMLIKSDIADEQVSEYYHSDDDPTPDSSPLELLLAATMPGVSRDPHGKDTRFSTNPHIGEDRSQFNKPGMGLTTLLNAVIDLLKGNVAIRSGKYFVNFKAPTEREKKYYAKSGKFRFNKLYRAKVVKYGGRMPAFKGNMITIRLPLKEV